MSELEERKAAENPSISNTLIAIFRYLPFFLGVLLINRLYVGDLFIAGVFVVTITIVIFFRNLLIKRGGKNIPLFLSIFFIVSITIIVTYGNGVHDVGMVSFPVVLGFATLTLSGRNLLVVFILSFLSIVWVIIGESEGLYERQVIGVANAADFLITGTLVSLGGFIAYRITKSLKNSLEEAGTEYARTMEVSQQLEKEVEEKMTLISQVHKKAIKSLSYISRLNEPSNPINRKIMSIETAHRMLDEWQDYEWVPVKDYVEVLVSKYCDHYTVTEPWDLQLDEFDLKVDKCISFGICLLELVHRTGVSSQKDSPIRLSVSRQEGQVQATVTSKQLTLHEESDPSSFVIQAMTQQLKGTLEVSQENGTHVQHLRFGDGG